MKKHQKMKILLGLLVMSLAASAVAAIKTGSVACSGAVTVTCNGSNVTRSCAGGSSAAGGTGQTHTEGSTACKTLQFPPECGAQGGICPKVSVSATE
jgi:hypothetical protein